MWKYKQITSERDLSTTNFPNGEIKYKYRMPPGHQINLDKSFIRMRCKLSKANGNQLDTGDLIAPNYLMAYGLFKQMYHCINGVQVGEVRSYCSQVGALRHRITYPQSYKDKFLATTNFAKIDFDQRQNDIITKGIQDEGSLKRQSFHMLNQADGTHILGTEELRVNENVAGSNTGNLVEYRNAGGGGNGAIDLRQTELEIGDKIVFNNNLGLGQTRSIVAINQFSVQIDGREIPTFPSEDILGSVFFYEKRGGKKSKQSQEFELVFKPPMGVWHKDVWLASHDMELKLYPHPDGTYQKNVIESIGTNRTHGSANDFLFEVEDMIMYVALLKQKHEDGEYACSYDDMRCQLTNLTTTSNVDNHFVVDRDAHSFTVAFQDENVENNTQYSATKFKIRNDEELKLNRYYIDYNGIILPDPYPQIEKTSSKDFLTQRYYESIMYSDANNSYDVESLDDWQNAGVFFTHKFGKSMKQTEKVTVSTLFENDAFTTNQVSHNPNLLLFDHFTRTFKMVVSNGVIRDVYADKVN